MSPFWSSDISKSKNAGKQGMKGASLMFFYKFEEFSNENSSDKSAKILLDLDSFVE